MVMLLLVVVQLGAEADVRWELKPGAIWSQASLSDPSMMTSDKLTGGVRRLSGRVAETVAVDVGQICNRWRGNATSGKEDARDANATGDVAMVRKF
jgi:hypothetical protein